MCGDTIDKDGQKWSTEGIMFVSPSQFPCEYCMNNTYPCCIFHISALLGPHCP